MEQEKIFQTKNVLIIGFLAIILAIFSLIFSFWQTPNYKTSSRLLVVFNQNNIDTYTASKTANYITGILNEAIYSESFINLVYKNESRLTDNLGLRSETRIKNWKRNIKVKVLENKGILIIDVFGENKNQVNLLSNSINQTLINQHGFYDGSEDRVTIRLLDNSIIYEKWSMTRIIRDTLLGLIAGLFLGLTFVIIFPNHKIFVFDFNKKYEVYRKPTSIKEQKINYQPQINPTPKIEEPKPFIRPETNNEVIQEKINEATNQNTYNEENTIKTNNPWLKEYYQDNFKNKQ